MDVSSTAHNFYGGNLAPTLSLGTYDEYKLLPKGKLYSREKDFRSVKNTIDQPYSTQSNFQNKLLISNKNFVKFGKLQSIKNIYLHNRRNHQDPHPINVKFDPLNKIKFMWAKID